MRFTRRLFQAAPTTKSFFGIGAKLLQFNSRCVQVNFPFSTSRKVMLTYLYIQTKVQARDDEHHEKLVRDERNDQFKAAKLNNDPGKGGTLRT